MAVDLADLVDSLRREISPPGEDVFPNALEDDLIGHLSDAFWEARLDGLLTQWTETDGVVSPIKAGGDDMPRELQQLVVFYAGFRIVRNHIRNLNTLFKATAGPVNYEVQKSANVLKDLLADLRAKRLALLDFLRTSGQAPSYVLDSIITRSEAMMYGDISWVR